MRFVARLLPIAAAALLAACAASAPGASPAEEPARTPLDRVLARLVVKGEWDKLSRAADSAAAGKEPTDREIAAYWKSVGWLYRDEPDSALVLLEAQQGKWTAGMRKVHGGLLLKLAREMSAARASRNGRPDEAAPKTAAAAGDKALQERVDALQKENADLRAENQRLETEKEKYQKLLKDLETIR